MKEKKNILGLDPGMLDEARLKRLLEGKDISAFCEYIRLPEVELQNLLAGKFNPSPEKIAEMAYFLGIAVEKIQVGE